MGISFTAPTPAEVISGVKLAQYTIDDSPHHVQLEWRAAGGLWERMSAWNAIAPYEASINTFQLPNGSYELRVREFSGDDESTAYATATVSVTVTNAAGTTRNYVGGTDLFSAAVTAAADGDTIRLTGDFADEGSSISVNKRVKIIRHPAAGVLPTIRSKVRCPATGAGRYFEQLTFAHGSPNTTAAGTSDVYEGCVFDNVRVGGVGHTVGESYDFNSVATDPKWSNCIFRNSGDAINDAGFAPFHIHGVYVEMALRPFFINCKSYDNAGRGFQLYPNCQQGVVYKSLAYGCNMAVDIGGDVGEATATTLTATLNAPDSSATVGSTANWPSSGTVQITSGAKTEYVTYTGKTPTTVTGLGTHTAFAITNGVDVYTFSNYCKIERSILGFTGTQGGSGLAGRNSSEGIVFGFWGSASPLGTPTKGTGNIVFNCVLHDPALAGLGAGVYFDIDSAVDANHGGYTKSSNRTGTDPGYVSGVGRNFQLARGAAAQGYGPDSIQYSDSSVARGAMSWP